MGTDYTIAIDPRKYRIRRDNDVLMAIDHLSRGGKCRICWDRIPPKLYGYSVDEVKEALTHLRLLGKIQITFRTDRHDRTFTTAYIKLIKVKPITDRQIAKGLFDVIIRTRENDNTGID